MNLLVRNHDAKLERLRELTLFAHADKKALRQLGAIADELHVPAGHVLVNQDDAFHEVYLVTAGTAVVERDGEEVSIVLPGEIIGQVALFCHCPASGTISARSDLEVLVMPITRFWQVLHQHPDLTTQVARVLANELLEADEVHEGHHVL